MVNTLNLETLETLPRSRDNLVVIQVMGIRTEFDFGEVPMLYVDIEECGPDHEGFYRKGEVIVRADQYEKLVSNKLLLVREIDVLWTGCRPSSLTMYRNSW